MTDPIGQLAGSQTLRIDKPVYGGDGLARTDAGEVVFVPFALPGELVERIGDGTSLHVLQPSPARVQPRCVHFGACGGCQYQMASYGAQLELKAAILRETLQRAEVPDLPAVQLWESPEPWGYRNRIRLRVREAGGTLQLGYHRRRTNEFLPVVMCPIAAPVLAQTAHALLAAGAQHPDAREWLRAAAEVELVCDEIGSQVQIHLLCPKDAPRGKDSLEDFARALLRAAVPLRSMGASRLHLASGRPLEELASWAAEGIAYKVEGQSFWLKRGSFFQVNRSLVPRMVELVCRERAGALAWDLYAGVGLFARALTRRFEAVTAVEANPVALEELRRGLRRAADAALGETTLGFLRKAVLQRDRPSLIVLDPPRAGAGEEVCALLLRLGPSEIVYVSCDPTTLARDLKVLTTQYTVAELHMVDLFPQTYHLETVMALRRRDVEA